MKWKDGNCNSCENGIFDTQIGEYRCKLNQERECISFETGEIKLFKPRGTKTKETVADETAYELYKYLKAKIFNVLESQIAGIQLGATKKIAEDYISSASAMIKHKILEMK